MSTCLKQGHFTLGQIFFIENILYSEVQILPNSHNQIKLNKYLCNKHMTCKHVNLEALILIYMKAHLHQSEEEGSLC